MAIARASNFSFEPATPLEGETRTARAKLMPKIILQDTRLTHKTDIAFALNEHPKIVGPRRHRYDSPLISAEWCAFTPWPWGRGPINFEAAEEALALETHAAWARFFELNRYYSFARRSPVPEAVVAGEDGGQVGRAEDDE